MTSESTESSAGNPLNEFSGCHEGIVENLKQLQQMLVLLGESPTHPDIRRIAKNMIAFYREVMLLHHEEEEHELFTAVMDAAANEDEASVARDHIKRLVAEHRELERMWLLIEPDMKLLAKGKDSHLDHAIAGSLAQQYLEHADFEERVFLPLAASILSKNDLSALGLSLHMRHQQASTKYYI